MRTRLDLILTSIVRVCVCLLLSQSPHFAAVRQLRFPGRHLVVLVHGYQGNSWDMRLFRNVLAVLHPDARFHCSTVNEGLTEGDIEAMGRRLADEVDAQVGDAGGSVGGGGGDHDVTRISFIGHSLGGLIIRAALTAPSMSAHLAKLHTLVTLASPFCGYLFNQSRLLTSGLYVMQRMFGSSCLLQLSLQDHADPRQTFVYRLAHQPGLQLFRNVVLLSSPEDQVWDPWRAIFCRICIACTLVWPILTSLNIPLYAISPRRAWHGSTARSTFPTTRRASSTAPPPPPIPCGVRSTPKWSMRCSRRPPPPTPA